MVNEKMSEPMVELYEPDYLPVPARPSPSGRQAAGGRQTGNLESGTATRANDRSKTPPIQNLIKGISKHITATEKYIWKEYQTYNINTDIKDLYSLQNCLIELDMIAEKIAKIQAQIKEDYDSELKTRVDMGEFEYSDYIIVPVMKKTNRSVDEDTLKQYYRPFFDKIIEAKITTLEETYKVRIKDVEMFMGSLAKKVIKPGAEAIARYEIRLRE